MDIQNILETIGNWCATAGVKVLISIVILIIAFFIINKVLKNVQKAALASGKIDKTIAKTLIYAGKIALKVLVILALVGYLGIDTSGITALIASLGVAAGLAINGTLSNLAGGVMLLITRPFKEDDFIETCGQSGTVVGIHITYTEIETPDNKVVHLPNGTLSTSTVINYTEKGKRRVDINFSVSYRSDYKKAEQIIIDLANSNPAILKDPAPFAKIVSQSQSSIDIVSRSWVDAADYWDVYFFMLEGVKDAFDANGIEIPYNQLDVHVKND